MEYNKVEKKYSDFLKKYDKRVKRNKMKYEHSFKVANIMGELAARLNLNDEEVNISKVIGLLHDIGRFEQVKLYNTFKDIKFDHALEGANYLFERGHIRDYLDEEKYDKVIYHAIKNHNKFEIETGLDKESLKYSKMIRDADKIDIFRVLSKTNKKIFDKDELSDEILNSFYSHKSCLISEQKKSSDNVIFIMAFIYDFNFKESLEILNEKKHFEEWLSVMPIKKGSEEEFEKLVNYVKKYIKEKIEC